MMGSRLERWKHYWTETGVIPRWQLVTIYALFIAIVIAGWGQTAHESKVRSDQNRALIEKVQRQRADAAREACQAQNQRHGEAIPALRRLSQRPVRRQAPLTPAQKRRQKEVLEEFVQIFIPVRDCAAVVDAVVRRTEP